LFATLSAGLGRPLSERADRGSAWRRLVEAARLCRFQSLRVVLAVDNCQFLRDPVDRLDLERLEHVDPHPEARITVLRAGRAIGEDNPGTGWGLPIRLAPLTRTEANRYLVAKLAAAGRHVPTFTPQAVTRLHARAGGVPRGLDRLATLCLMAGAATGAQAVTPEVIDVAS
jgi:type II secretory pathway predicted ATPase ExeA